MTIEVMEAVMPACWASALINGDDSSFSLDDDGGKAEIAAIEAEAAEYAREGWYVVDVKRDKAGEAEEPWFSWNYSGHGGTAHGGDVITYILHRVRSFWYLQKVQLNQGGYDRAGCYYGAGPPALWRTEPKGGTSSHDILMIRARDRADAMAQIKAKHPTARFFGKGAK